MDNEERQKFIDFIKKYGFDVEEKKKIIYLLAKNTDGKLIRWIEYHYGAGAVGFHGNTDFNNLWFHETRPDLTPDKLIEFVKDLNEAANIYAGDRFRLKELIDPEDWQEIARVHDAYSDMRYVES